MEIVLIKSCFLYYIHAPHQRFTATSRCSTPIVLQNLDAQHLLQEQQHAQLRLHDVPNEDSLGEAQARVPVPAPGRNKPRRREEITTEMVSR